MTDILEATLRTYNVGFGDCMLLLLDYTDGVRRSMLFDFGTTKLPDSAPRDRMAHIAADIEEACRGKLNVLVATHRHADHISGFGDEDTGPMIESLTPDVVVQPWTEEPGLATDATAPRITSPLTDHRALAATLLDMQAFAAGAAAEGARLYNRENATRSPHEVRRGIGAGLQFLGETNLTNRAAVKQLMSMGTRHIYAAFGNRFDDLLPNVKIEVLGPPTLDQASDIARQARTNADEFWHLAGAWGLASQTGDAAGQDLGPLFADREEHIPRAAQWLVPRIHRAHAYEMMSLLRRMDQVLNNTSLILLLTLNEKTTLLFPGDAQIENWSYALFDADNHEDIVQRLSLTDLYKVGHHGSLNATPKTLWNGFANKDLEDDKPGRLITVLSTLSGHHGNSRRRTEVPRTTLVKELQAYSEYYSTRYRNSLPKPYVDVRIPLR